MNGVSGETERRRRMSCKREDTPHKDSAMTLLLSFVPPASLRSRRYEKQDYRESLWRRISQVTGFFQWLGRREGEAGREDHGINETYLSLLLLTFVMKLINAGHEFVYHAIPEMKEGKRGDK